MLCAILFGTVVGFCPDETISGYANPDTTWHLTHLDGEPFTARATITFPEEGRVTGRGPCNGFTAGQGIAYPWIEITRLAATKMACADLPAETAYFTALTQMTLAEVSDRVLILSNDKGDEMLFEAR